MKNNKYLVEIPAEIKVFSLEQMTRTNEKSKICYATCYERTYFYKLHI